VVVAKFGVDGFGLECAQTGVFMHTLFSSKSHIGKKPGRVVRENAQRLLIYFLGG
jgi:hypothetical protein